MFNQVIPYYKPFILDYSEIEEKLREVVETGRYTKGKYKEELEEKLKEFLNVEYVICCAGGTSALFIAMNVLKRVFKFETIAIPSFTWKSTRMAAEWNGYKVAFADIDKETWTMDNERLPDADLVCGMDTFGNRCDIDVDPEMRMNDSAHSLGTKGIGSRGLVECFSLTASKIITAGGEGGAIATNKKEIYNKCLEIRDFASRMSEMQAIVGLSMLDKFEDILKIKKDMADYYHKNLPYPFQKITESNYYAIGMLIDDRGNFVKKNSDIEFKLYYSEPLKLGLSNTDYVAKRICCLPCAIDLDYQDVVKRIGGRK